MGYDLHDSPDLQAPKHLDKRYGPYASPEEANLKVKRYRRKEGLTVGITQLDNTIIEYWWEEGVEDVHLVPKPGSYPRQEAVRIPTVKVGKQEAKRIPTKKADRIPTVKVSTTEAKRVPTKKADRISTVKVNPVDAKRVPTKKAERIPTVKVGKVDAKRIPTKKADRIPTVKVGSVEATRISTRKADRIETVRMGLTEVGRIPTTKAFRVNTVRVDNVLTNAYLQANTLVFENLGFPIEVNLPEAYQHPTGFTNLPAQSLEGLDVISRIDVTAQGHATNVIARTLPHKRFGRVIIPAFPNDNNVYLDGTGNWRTTSWLLKVNAETVGTAVNPEDDVVFSEGANITITRSGRLVTIASTVEVPPPELFDHNLTEHLDVSASDPVTGQLIRYGGAGWVNWTPNFLTSFTEVDPVFVAWRDAERAQSTFWGAPYGSVGPAVFRQINYQELLDKPTIPTGFTLSSDLLQGGNNSLNSYSTSQATQRRFYTTEHLPTGTERLSIGAYFYATRLYDGGTRVSVHGHGHPALVRGTGLTGIDYIATTSREWAVDFDGTGISNKVARSDHDHNNDYDKYSSWMLKADVVEHGENPPVSVGVGTGKLVYFKGAGGTNTKVSEVSGSWVVEITSQNLQSELLKAGNGLTGSSYDGSAEVTWAVSFAGSGSAITAAKSDHLHTGVYEPIGAAAAAVSSHESTYNHVNYNTAFGWGNHAQAGYSTVTTFLGLTDTPGFYVEGGTNHSGKVVVVNDAGTALTFSAFSQSQNIPNFYVTNLVEFLAAYNNIRDNFPGGNIYINGIVELTSNLILDLTGINIYGSGDYGMIKFCNGTTAAATVYRITITDGNPSFSKIWFSGSTEQSTLDTRTWPNRYIFRVTTTKENRLYFDDCIFSNIVCGGTSTPNILLDGNYIQYSTQYIYFNKCLFYSHSGSLSAAPAYTYNGFIIKYENIYSDYARIKIVITNQIASTGNGNTVGASLNNSSTRYNLDKNTKEPIKVDFVSDETAWLGSIGTLLEATVQRNNYINELPEVEEEAELKMDDDDYLYFSRTIERNNHYRVKYSILKDLLFAEYTHPIGFGNVPATALSNAAVISRITVNTEGHVTGVSTRNLTAANVGASPTGHTHTMSEITDLSTDNNYLTGITFNNTTGLLTFTREGLANLTCSIENRYALIAHTHLWAHITDKPATFAPSAHTLDSHASTNLAGLNALITDANLDAAGTARPPTAHNHAWSHINSGVPATATRWPTWSEVTSKPTLFSPSAHNHAWSEITSGVPATATRWPTHAEVTNKPDTATRWPSFAEVTGKPNTYAPDTHGHASHSDIDQSLLKSNYIEFAQITTLRAAATQEMGSYIRNTGTTTGTKSGIYFGAHNTAVYKSAIIHDRENTGGVGSLYFCVHQGLNTTSVGFADRKVKIERSSGNMICSGDIIAYGAI